MNKIEEMSFTIDKTRCTYKLYKYEEETMQKVKVPVEIGEITSHMGYKYIDTKVKITKYALHQEFENENGFQDKIVCETEMYATINTVIKDILSQYIKMLEGYYRL